MNELPNKPFLTRRGAVQHVKDVTGAPFKLSSFAKLAMHGEAPEPDAYYGKVELYTPENIEQWAVRRLLSREPKTLNVNGRKNQDATIGPTSAPFMLGLGANCSVFDVWLAYRRSRKAESDQHSDL